MRRLATLAADISVEIGFRCKPRHLTKAYQSILIRELRYQVVIMVPIQLNQAKLLFKVILQLSTEAVQLKILSCSRNVLLIFTLAIFVLHIFLSQSNIHAIKW